jgi:hypothetical protein
MIAHAIRKVVPARWRPITYLEQHTFRSTGGRVHDGPFKGMRYIERAQGSAYIPKLLGMYERELNPAVERAIAAAPGLVIDIGAAEGYYAVGLAMRLPGAKVVAFEMSEKGQQWLREMAELNGITGRVEVRGRCDRADLHDLLAAGVNPGALVVCDCEGFEAILLDPLRAPELTRSTIIVESHDFILPGIADEMTERFKPTHKIERIWSTDRRPEEYPFRSTYLSLLPTSYKAWVVSEWRPTRMSWLVMEPLQP